ncbi:MAG: GGDEF domain-containing protein, partial [Chloroflexota bacterium]|nr:GGDEF domain-containing protein [Chloroflexota bacterium]
VRRRPLYESLFNTSQAVLMVGVGGLVLSSLGWTSDALRGADPWLLAPLLPAVLATWLVDNLTIAGIVALQHRRSFLAVWRELVLEGRLELAAQYVVGLLAAMLLANRPLLLPILLVPALVVYRSSQRQLSLAKQAGELEHQAFHDPLTDLPNRALLADRLEQAVVRAKRRGTQVAVLLLDLDRFKTVNDSLGHNAGDELLVAAAERLKTCVRSEDTVTRLGGDEFAVLLEGITSPVRAERVARRIIQALESPFALARASCL